MKFLAIIHFNAKSKIRSKTNMRNEFLISIFIINEQNRSSYYINEVSHTRKRNNLYLGQSDSK